MSARLLPVILSLLAACKDAPKPTPTDPAAKPGADPRPNAKVGIDIPEVVGTGYQPLTDVGTTVTASDAGGIVVTSAGSNKAIVALHAGAVDPSDMDGGALGIKIPELTAYLAQLARVSPPGRLVLILDRHMPYKLLIELMFSAKQKEAGWKDFGVLAKVGEKLVMVPITLPDRTPPQPGDGDLGGAIARLVDESSLTADVVMKKIQTSYMSAIERCYKDQLKVEPAAKGRLTLAFTVGAKGTVTDANVAGMNEVLDKCVETALRTWKFPKPTDHSGDPTESSFSITLQLVPEGDAPAAPLVTAGPAADKPPEEPADLKLVVTAAGTDLTVWSITGLEGTLQAPKLSVPIADKTAVAQVSTVLAEIVRRRWPDTRPETGRSIMVMADGKTPMQLVAEIMGAVRATPDGVLLFPDILLSPGIE